MNKHLKKIKKIREDNNDLWMTILEIALNSDPERTKKVLSRIRANDLLITQNIGDIVYEDSRS